MDYRKYDDNELLSYIQENNEDAYNIIYEKYRPLITKIVKKISNVLPGTGIEESDLYQEGMIGLSRAINHYQDHKDTLFYTYAKKCIERNVYTTVLRSQQGNKDKALNESYSIDQMYGKSEDLTYADLFPDDRFNPEKNLSSEEDTTEILKLAEKKLTPLEHQIFELKINGFNIDDIAKIIGKDYKAVDNALQRIKLKLKETRK